MNSCYKRYVEQRKSDEFANEEEAVPKCPDNFVHSLEKSADKDLCEVSEEKVLDVPFQI